MHTLNPTKDTGSIAKANDLVYVEPGLTVTDDALAGQFGLSGVNGAFIADFLSACLTHERCGAHLYRSVATRTANPVLQGRYEAFGRQTVRHVEILEEVIEVAGGNPSYVSPLARTVETADSKALEATYLASGGVDVMAAETAMLDAVFMAETVDHANWETLEKLAESLPHGLLRDALSSAVAEVEDDEDDHLNWACSMRARLTMLQASSSMVTKATAKAEELVAQVRGWFGEGDHEVGSADVLPTAPTGPTTKATQKTAAKKKPATAKKKPATAKKSPVARKKAAAKKSATKRTATAKKSAKKRATAKKPPANKKNAASKKSPAKKKAAKKRAPAKKRTSRSRRS